MTQHPYSDRPDHAYWSRAVASLEPGTIDPVTAAKFRLNTADKVVTAGSCFAQHIARHLKAAGFNYLVTEAAPEAMDNALALENGYGTFSARYGNVYTTRQLRQLVERVYGDFVPSESSWPAGDAFVDPFRPRIQPGGFADVATLEADRQTHFAAVRRAFEEMDVFVFTLGLTEAWASREDGVVYPVAPGVAGGTFSPDRHVFCNFSVEEVVADMRAALAALRRVNPLFKVLLTVSPVPLAATAEDRHVLVSTAVSKAKLRVAAEELTRGEADIDYFPSYEIITSPASRGRYYAQDAREVTERGVEHVMRVFFAHYTSPDEQTSSKEPAAWEDDDYLAEAEAAAEADCDEILLDMKREDPSDD